MEKLTDKDLLKLNSKKGLISLLATDIVNPQKSIRYIDYIKKLKKLQVELIKLQTHIIENNQKVIVIFEGRDAAGKGGGYKKINGKNQSQIF